MPSIVYDYIGQQNALSVINSSHTPVTLKSLSNDQISYCSLLNTGIGIIAVNMGATGTVTQAQLPTEGNPTPGNIYQVIVPPSMTAPMIVSCPRPPFDITAISNTAVASQLFVALAGAQS